MADLPIRRLLQTSVALMCALGALLLGMGERNLLLPMLAMTAALTSLTLTDRLGIFKLSRPVANLLAIFAVLLAIVQFTLSYGVDQLLAIANLLIYLQIVLMHQEKNERLYWQLMLLSLLQVVVAAALNLGLEFGLLLLAYMFVSLTALVTFFLVRESERLAEPRAAAEPSAGREIVLLPAAHDHSALAPSPGRTLRYVGLLGCATLGVAAAMFFAMPRLGQAVLRNVFEGRQRVVGFNPTEIDLGSIGEILQKDQSVLRMICYDERTGVNLGYVGEPYLRGAVLGEYVGGNWRVGSMTALSSSSALQPPPDAEFLTRVSIVLEDSRDSLFAVLPAYRVEETPASVRFDRINRQLVRYERSRPPSGPFRYALGTTALRFGRQTAFVPHESLLADEDDRISLRREKAILSQFNNARHRLDGIEQLAQQIVADSGLPPEDRVGRVRALEAYFLDPARFTYSLESHPKLNRASDPIEDFVTNTRSGHCEYFASALVLMLRSQGIPARIAVGFKGGAYNSVGSYYQIRQRDAHAWVEVYLEPEHVSAVANLTAEQAPAGGWLRLDPTPASPEQEAEASEEGIFSQLRQLMEYARLLWNDYVLGLDSQRQREAIYQPLLDSLRDGIEQLFSAEAWQAFFQGSLALLGIDIASWLGEDWFGWRGAIVLLLMLGLVAALAYWVVVPAVRRAARGLWSSRPAGEKPPARRVIHIEFYQRLEKLLAKVGLQRRPQQTQREFALAAAAHLAHDPSLSAAASAPRRVAEAFYRVRFGRAELDNSEVLAVENALGVLAQAIAGQRKS